MQGAHVMMILMKVMHLALHGVSIQNKQIEVVFRLISTLAFDRKCHTRGTQNFNGYNRETVMVWFTVPSTSCLFWCSSYGNISVCHSVFFRGYVEVKQFHAGSGSQSGLQNHQWISSCFGNVVCCILQSQHCISI